MNVQVMLLVGITGLFMLAWNGDPACSRSEYTVAVYPAPLRVYAADATNHAIATKRPQPSFRSEVVARVASAAPGRINVDTTSVPRRQQSHQTVEATTSHSVTCTVSVLPIPADLPCGHYKAVNDRGDVREFVLPPQEGAAAASSQDDFHTAEANGICWYFVRINK